MEFASRLRWFMVIGVVLLALILIGWGMFSIANSIFRADSSLSSNETLVEDKSIDDVKGTAQAEFTVDGPVVANEEHRSYTIEVSKSVVSFKLYKGYGQTVLAQKSYTNTPESYEAFLSALANLNVAERRKNTIVDNDFEEVGVCPTGERYVLELGDIRRWRASCSRKVGTAATSLLPVKNLFEKQVIDFRDLVRGTGL